MMNSAQLPDHENPYRILTNRRDLIIEKDKARVIRNNRIAIALSTIALVATIALALVAHYYCDQAWSSEYVVFPLVLAGIALITLACRIHKSLGGIISCFVLDDYLKKITTSGPLSEDAINSDIERGTYVHNGETISDRSSAMHVQSVRDHLNGTFGAENIPWPLLTQSVLKAPLAESYRLYPDVAYTNGHSYYEIIESGGNTSIIATKRQSQKSPDHPEKIIGELEYAVQVNLKTGSAIVTITQVPLLIS